MSTNNSLTASLGRVVPAFSKGITDNSVVNFLLQEANNQNLSKEQQRFFWHILFIFIKLSMIRCMFGSGEEGGLKEGGIVNNSRSPSCWHLNPSEVLTVLDHLALWGPSGPSKVTLIVSVHKKKTVFRYLLAQSCCFNLWTYLFSGGRVSAFLTWATSLTHFTKLNFY